MIEIHPTESAQIEQRHNRMPIHGRRLEQSRHVLWVKLSSPSHPGEPFNDSSEYLRLVSEWWRGTHPRGLIEQSELPRTRRKIMPVTEEKILLTQEGWRRLHEELAALRKQRGLELNEHIEAGHSGDWVESAAHYNNSNVTTLNRRIMQLEEVLHRSIPVGPADREPGKVGVGSRVVVQWEDGEREDYIIGGPPEVDTSAGKISYEAPVGRALMGSRAGMWVDVKTPEGSCRLQIITVV